MKEIAPSMHINKEPVIELAAIAGKTVLKTKTVEKRRDL